MFSLDINDFWKGLIMAVLSPAFVALTGVIGSIIQAPGFDVFMVNWATLGHNLVNVEIVVAYGAFTGYILKNFFTTSKGSFLNVTPNS